MTEPLPLWEAARREMEEYQFLANLDVQPKWDVPPEIAIHVAISGRAADGVLGDDAEQYPQSVDDYIDAAASVIEAGATGVHVDFTFVKDREGRRLDTGEVPMAESYKLVLDPLRDRFGDGFISNLNVLNGKSFDACLAPARAGLADVAPCAAGHPDAFVIPAIRVLEESGVKPEIVVHSSGEIELANRKLMEPGLVSQPTNWIILFGLPFNSGRTLLSGTWIRNTADMAKHLMLMVEQIKDIDTDAVISVCAAGRSTYYMTTLATMLGLNIRVGTEDTVWKYPNSDELLESNLEMFTTARDIAAMLGRKVMSAKQYRRTLGIGSSERAA